MNRMFRNLTAAGGLAAVAATGLFTVSNVAGAQESSTQTAPVDAAGAPNRPRLPLTEAERQCLTDHGASRPETIPTAEQREALRAALDACGIERPLARARVARFLRNLTEEQRTCLRAELAEAGFDGEGEGQRPRLPSPERRQAVKDAAEACGITLPARPAGAAQPAA